VQYAPASVLGESNGRASVAKSTPARALRTPTRSKQKPTQSPAAKIPQPNLERRKIEVSSWTLLNTSPDQPLDDSIRSTIRGRG
jgi:hypothetical protein